MIRRYATYPSLDGTRAFVTGGATGIGAAIVRMLAGQGVCVGFVDLATEAGEALAADLPGAWFRRVDVTDTSALRAAIGDFADAGPIDTLVNNVANDTRHDWREVTPDQWDRALAVNLRPAFFAIQAVAPGMIDRRRGSVINYGSISWKAKLPSMPAYTSAKAAIHGLTRSFVEPLGAAGARINTVVPGWVMTDRQKTLHYDAAGAEMLAAKQPLAGQIQPEDAAALTTFLAADDSAMCTGQEFTIDGGWI